MRHTLFLLLFFLSQLLIPKTMAFEIHQAQRFWSDFLSCKTQIKNELNLINCVDPLLSSTLARPEKVKLTSFLIMEYSFSDLHSCEGIKDLLPGIPKKNETYFCMHVLGHKSKLNGYITLTMEHSKPKLKSIKYND